MERDPRDLTGQIIDGRYRVEYELGRGGMGRVWSVQHVESRAHWALKTLELELAADAGARERLAREARAASALRTRHVVRVLDARTDYVHAGRALPFLVMERLEGCTLEEWLALRGPLAPAQLLWVIGQVGRALSLAHERGIVHRDLKPSNVFISADEDGAPLVKLCDFGIAKFTSLAAASLITRSGAGTSAKEVLGTPLYLAPELLRGAALATAATDQWGLALTVFKALSAREYFASASSGPELVLKIAHDPLVPPSQLAVQLPQSFDAWFMRSCSREPAGRFDGVTAQLLELANALGNPQPASVPVELKPSIVRAAVPAETPRKQVSPARGRGASPSRRAGLAFAIVWASAGTLAFLFSEPAASPQRAPRRSMFDVNIAANAASARVTAAPPVSSESTELPLATAEADTLPAAETPPPPGPRAAPRPNSRISGASAARGRPSGAPCQRSAECASGLCVAERCR